MKMYLLFSGNQFYPIGGFRDFDMDFDSIDEAIEHFKAMNHDWYQIVQSSDFSIVDEFPAY